MIQMMFDMTNEENITYDYEYMIRYVFEYIKLHLSQILLLIALSYVTAFRREISCNSDYASTTSTSYSSSSSLASSSTETTAGGSSSDTSDDLLNEVSIHHYDILESNSSPLLLELTEDLQIQCLSYLHPRDILSLSCCNKLSRFLIDDYHHRSSTTTKNRYILKYRSMSRFLAGRQSLKSIGDSDDVGVEQDNTLALDHNNDNQNDNHLEQMQLHMHMQVEMHCFSDTLWLDLWNRDYAWILYSWKIGKDALRRSLLNIVNHNASIVVIPKALISVLPPCIFEGTSMTQEQLLTMYEKQQQQSSTQTPISMKEFYLTFSQTWLNYTIAGQSTFDQCLTGIHGHVFNITNFLSIHPGSPESLIVQGGGRDSTAFFESVGHSFSARKIAVRQLVEVVDFGCCTSSSDGDVGLCDSDRGGGSGGNHTSNHHERRKKKNGHRSNSFDSQGSNGNGHSSSSSPSWPLCGLKPTANKHTSLIPRNRSRPKRTMGTIRHIKQTLHRGEENAKRKAGMMTRKNKSIMGSVNVYFDPIGRKWHGWYLDSEFDPVFVNDILS